jgi:hypothetical protein
VTKRDGLGPSGIADLPPAFNSRSFNDFVLACAHVRGEMRGRHQPIVPSSAEYTAVQAKSRQQSGIGPMRLPSSRALSLQAAGNPSGWSPCTWGARN